MSVGSRSGADLYRFRDQSRLRLWATENIVSAPLGCSCVSYWTVLRSPVSRILSRMYKRTLYGRFAQHNTVLGALNHTMLLNSSWLIPGMPEFSGTPAVDNYHVRSLGGPSVYRLSLGRLTEDHLRVAMARLAAMNVVPMPNLSSPATAKWMRLRPNSRQLHHR